MRSVLARMDALLAEAVAEEVAAYLLGATWRRCAACGARFKPRTGDHHLCGDRCRARWYRGKFKPRGKR